MCRGRSGWATVQTPCGVEIGGQKLGRSTQDDGTAPHYRHRRNNFSPNVEAFSRDAVSLARLRHQHRTLGLNVWMIHGRMIVGHSRHAVGRLTAVALTFRSCVAFAHESADPAWSNPGEQDRQQNYRSCGSSRHFGKLYLRVYEMRKLAQEPSSTGVFLTRTQMKRSFPRGEFDRFMCPLLSGRVPNEGSTVFDGTAQSTGGGPSKSGNPTRLCSFEVRRSACH
jgi:hypothetical protein